MATLLSTVFPTKQTTCILPSSRRECRLTHRRFFQVFGDLFHGWKLYRTVKKLLLQNRLSCWSVLCRYPSINVAWHEKLSFPNQTVSIFFVISAAKYWYSVSSRQLSKHFAIKLHWLFSLRNCHFSFSPSTDYAWQKLLFIVSEFSSCSSSLQGSIKFSRGLFRVLKKKQGRFNCAYAPADVKVREVFSTSQSR